MRALPYILILPPHWRTPEGTSGLTKNFYIMAKKEISLIGLIKAAGGEVSVKFSKLWSAPEIMAEGIEPSQIEIRVSTDYENSIFAIL